MTQDRLTLLSGYKYMKLEGRKHPGKLLNVNWMAAGLRLFRYNHGFFLIPASFSNMFFSQHL